MKSGKKSDLTIALPEGKNLGPQTLELLCEARIIVKRENPRAIEAVVEGIPDITRAIFCRPEQVAELVGDGLALFGITGKDVILENPQPSIEICAELPYSRQTADGTQCVLFTRADNPIKTLEDMRPLGIFGTHGGIAEVRKEQMIVSDYPAQTEAFLREQGLNFWVIPSRGSSEVLVYLQKYLFGVALVETGGTLYGNRLVKIEGGKISDSSTVLIGNKFTLGGNLDDPETERLRSLQLLLAGLLKGTLEARRLVHLAMNARVSCLDQILKILPTLKSPTVTPLADPKFCSIASIVPSADVNKLILELDYRAEDFVILLPSTVM